MLTESLFIGPAHYTGIRDLKLLRLYHCPLVVSIPTHITKAALLFTQQNRWIWTRIEIEKVSFVITKPYTHIIYSTIRIHSNRLRSKYTWNFEILPWAKPLRQPTTDIALCESLINPRYLPFSFDPLRIYVSINENLIKFFSVLRALINTNCVIFYERNQQ